ncbi:fasciclin domain-containing protein [Ilumatobacter nonamiensis]|uniref:fasciclin domain-containing protein n=1 Tax=Ilumatobacter nonamiensis TaxID=467093 RepID=UPI000688343E|nr:fasciclin domain-containing protein [Ilumatobacter nonamiensis]
MAALAAAMLIAGAACSSAGVDDSESAIDDVSDEVDDVSDDVDEAAEDIDEAGGDLADVLADNGMESLASIVEEIDVTELVGTENFTFFAPSDEAFQSLDAGDLADLLADPTELDDVLRRHIVADTVDAAALSDMSSVETEGATTLDVTVEGDTVMVGDATVTRADIEVDNGVVHVVDRIFVDA